MNLADIIALAKQGYKPADIKELMSLAEPNELTSSGTDACNTLLSDEEPTAQDAPTPVQVTPEVKEEEPDYKALYEESQKALKVAQATNVRQNVQQDIPSDEDIVADAFRNFM